MPSDRSSTAGLASRVERPLLACGLIGPPLFVVVVLIAGATRADYDALQHPVSSLALSESGWVQIANFIVTGVLLLGFAMGLRPAWRRYGGGMRVPLLVGLVAVGLLGAGVWQSDPVSGYPPGTPMVPEGTNDGLLHVTFSSLVFLALPIACAVAAYRFASSGRRGWAAYSVVSAAALLAGLVLFTMGLAQQDTLMPVAGLFQRVTIIVGFAWLTALAWHLWRQPAAPPAAR